MKFGKELASQRVPEWQEKYMDYNSLKTLLKGIQHFRHKNRPLATPRGLKRRLSLFRAFSGLTNTDKIINHGSPTQDIENQAILVHSVTTRDQSRRYQTSFLGVEDEGGEYELVYFRRLDDEFNKVVKFYKSKVEEVVKEADMLSKQMDALIAFRIKVESPPQGWFNRSVEMTCLASDVAASTMALAASTPSRARASRRVWDVIEEEGPSSHGKSDASTDADDDEKEGKEGKTVKQEVQEKKGNSIRSHRPPASLEILNHVTMNNTLETPVSTIKGFLNVPKQSELSFSRENLNKVEQQLKRAFITFHHKLRLLKSYSFLNLLAFSKIMKKYDKITLRHASKSYLKMVDDSYLGSSDEVTKLIERVEATFIKHFANSNRRKGMNILRPKAKKERHRVTFSMGFLVGCTVALVLALILIVHARNIMEKEGRLQYMETMFPLYSLFGFVFLHMLMYAANIYLWRRYRVNYQFIFGFKEGTELGYREILLLCFALAVLALASIIANLDMEMDPKTMDYKAITELVPLGLVLLLVVILLCPFNIVYRSSRFFFLTCVVHCICAPLYKVRLPDYFLADQLTSQVQALRSLEFYVCYYGWGDYKHRENTCRTDDVFKIFYFIVAAVPYWSRLLQCLRRRYEEGNVMQGLNGLKYFSIIIAVSTRAAYTHDGGACWMAVAWIASAYAAAFATYWDIVVDWGLLQRNSKNPWLRNKLLVPHKSVYFGAMVLNVLLRFAWLETVFSLKAPNLHKETWIALVAVLEIIRRGIWNFFSLENEHLNNVGNYRAFKSVPLPFNYDEDDKNDG